MDATHVQSFWGKRRYTESATVKEECWSFSSLDTRSVLAETTEDYCPQLISHKAITNKHQQQEAVTNRGVKLLTIIIQCKFDSVITEFNEQI